MELDSIFMVLYSFGIFANFYRDSTVFRYHLSSQDCVVFHVSCFASIHIIRRILDFFTTLWRNKIILFIISDLYSLVNFILSKCDIKWKNMKGYIIAYHDRETKGVYVDCCEDLDIFIGSVQILFTQRVGDILSIKQDIDDFTNRFFPQTSEDINHQICSMLLELQDIANRCPPDTFRPIHPSWSYHLRHVSCRANLFFLRLKSTIRITVLKIRTFSKLFWKNKKKMSLNKCLFV